MTAQLAVGIGDYGCKGLTDIIREVDAFDRPWFVKRGVTGVSATAATLALALVLSPPLAEKAPPPPMSPIALPGAASRGFVVPMSVRITLNSSGPSTTIATSGLRGWSPALNVEFGIHAQELKAAGSTTFGARAATPDSVRNRSMRALTSSCARRSVI